jgi:polyisoprenoid-binding protein YceI
MLHSQVAFGVRHLVGQVRGTFGQWYAVIATREGDWTLGTVNVTVQTASLNTGNRFRDDDLRSDRFFAAGRYPAMTFKGTGFAVADRRATGPGARGDQPRGAGRDRRRGGEGGAA